MIITNIANLKIKSADFQGTAEELQSLVDCLEYELDNSSRKGIGLAAIQIGVPQKVALLKQEWYDKKLKIKRNQKYIVYNPQIIKKEQPFLFKGEGCLSLPDIYIDKQRFNYIKILNGDGTELILSGTLAVALQHEIEHFEGKLITD